MKLLKQSFAVLFTCALSGSFALSASALSVSGSVDAATQGIVSTDTGINETTGANAANVGIAVNVDGPKVLLKRADVETNAVESTFVKPATVKTRADLTGYIAIKMKDDKNIDEVQASSDNVAIIYKQYAMLFGLIPVTVDATATVGADGTARVSYPWYSFLAATNKSDLQAKIQNRIDTVFGVNDTIHASTSTEAVAKLSTSTQAKLVTAMQEELSTAANTSSKASI